MSPVDSVRLADNLGNTRSVGGVTVRRALSPDHLFFDSGIGRIGAEVEEFCDGASKSGIILEFDFHKWP
jgi:hypothetical protein